MSARRLVALYNGLGLDTATVRAQNPDTWHWSPTDELLASLIEVTDAGNRYFVAAHTKNSGDVPKPIKIPRPHQPKPRGTTLDEVIQRFKPTEIPLRKDE